MNQSSSALIAILAVCMTPACQGSTIVQLRWEHKSNPDIAIDRRVCASAGKVSDPELKVLMGAFLKSSNRYRLRRITIVSCDLREPWIAQALSIGSEAIGLIKEEGRPLRILLKEGLSDPRAFMAGNIPAEFFSFALSQTSSLGMAEFELRLKQRPSKEQAELISRIFSERMAGLGPKEWRGLTYLSWGYDLPSGPAYDLPERSWPYFLCYEGRCVLQDASSYHH